MFRPLVAAAALIALTAGSALAQNDAKPSPASTAARPDDAAKKPFDLMVGDKAPALTVDKWVKGEPITGFEKGKIYVVEFWATWCGPCIAAMPHLSELQKTYKNDGVTIIGMTSIDSRGNTLEKVERMVADKGEVMGFNVAWDTERKTNEAFMRASGQSGIPCSFVIDRDGKIAYIGHPTANGALDETLAQLVAGTFDLKKAQAAYLTQRANEGKMRPLQSKLSRAVGAQNWVEAHAAANEIADLDPVFGSQMLNAVSWTIIDPEGQVADKNLDVALAAAKRAVELSKGKDAAILDTLALAHFLKGDTAKAIEIQTTAVALAPEGDMKAELQARLEEFKAKK